MVCLVWAGVQRDGGVLLGTVPGGVELRRPQHAQHPEPDHHAQVDREARQELEERRLPRLQHLHLVDEHSEDESPVSRIPWYASPTEVGLQD